MDYLTLLFSVLKIPLETQNYEFRCHAIYQGNQLYLMMRQKIFQAQQLHNEYLPKFITADCVLNCTRKIL